MCPYMSKSAYYSCALLEVLALLTAALGSIGFSILLAAAGLVPTYPQTRGLAWTLRVLCGHRLWLVLVLVPTGVPPAQGLMLSVLGTVQATLALGSLPE